MSLAALLSNRKKSGKLIWRIDEHLLLNDDSEDRRDGKFHPSDLAYQFCPRAWALYNFHPDGLAVKVASKDARTSRIFGVGHALHARIQKYLGDMGILYGKWVSHYGGGVHIHEGFDPNKQGTVMDGTWEYCEVSLRHNGDNIVGHTDGLLNLDGEKWGLEIKSINSEGFKWVRDSPRDWHKNQAMIYMHCLEDARQYDLIQGISGFVTQPLKGFIALYENKDTQEMKEFEIPYDPVEVEDFMRGKRKAMKAALEYHTTGEFPQCRCKPGKEQALCKAFPE